MLSENSTRLQKLEILKGFTLAGGTNPGLRLDHRISVGMTGLFMKHAIKKLMGVKSK